MNREQLNARIAELAELETEPNRIADKILAELGAVEKREVAALVLPSYVRNRIGAGLRHRSRPADVPRSGKNAAVYYDGEGRKFLSAKLRDQSDWQRITTASVYVAGARKHFGECTGDEVRALVGARQKQAATLLAQAERFSRVNEAMADHHAERVRDLPKQVLLSIMTKDSE